MDKNGDSLIVAGLPGNTTAVNAYENQVNTGLGGFYTLGKSSTGRYVLNSTGQKGSMSTKQQAFFDVMNETISAATDVSFTVVDANDALSADIIIADNGNAVDNAGNNYSAVPGTHIIDVGDLGKFSSKGHLSAQGIIGHETKEGFEIQTKGYTTAAQIGAAHTLGINAENSIHGNTRIIQPAGVPDFSNSRYQPNNSGALKIQFNTGGNSQSSPGTVIATFTNGNVSHVLGNYKLQ